MNKGAPQADPQAEAVEVDRDQPKPGAEPQVEHEAGSWTTSKEDCEGQPKPHASSTASPCSPATAG